MLAPLYFWVFSSAQLLLFCPDQIKSVCFFHVLIFILLNKSYFLEIWVFSLPVSPWSSFTIYSTVQWVCANCKCEDKASQKDSIQWRLSKKKKKATCLFQPCSSQSARCSSSFSTCTLLCRVAVDHRANILTVSVIIKPLIMTPFLVQAEPCDALYAK